MPWQDLGLIAFGAILGFALSMLAEYIRRTLDRRNRRERGKQLLSAIVKEIEEGIARCQGLVQARNEGKISFSRIYIAFWESMRAELPQYIEDPEVLRLLYSIYYRFDLVNFNMEREEFGVGAAYAEEYLAEMEANLSSLKARPSSS